MAELASSSSFNLDADFVDHLEWSREDVAYNKWSLIFRESKKLVGVQLTILTS